MTSHRHENNPIPWAADEDAHREAPPAWGRFARGLTLGALVGAAIAGSAIWDRLRQRSDRTPDGARDRDTDAT